MTYTLENIPKKKEDFDGMLQNILHTNGWNTPLRYMTFANFYL